MRGTAYGQPLCGSCCHHVRLRSTVADKFHVQIRKVKVFTDCDLQTEVRESKPAWVVGHNTFSVDRLLLWAVVDTMDVARQTSLFTLDKDTSRRLVSILRVKEIIQMSQVCKAFWEVSCGASTLYCSLSFGQAPEEADASLMRFIRSRCQQGMEVRNAGNMGY